MKFLSSTEKEKKKALYTRHGLKFYKKLLNILRKITMG